MYGLGTIDAALATDNPAKIEGTERALRRLFEEFDLKCVPGPTGIPDQPIGLDQTLDGARRRAEHASAHASIGIGVEAGLMFSRSLSSVLLFHASCVKTEERRLAYGLSSGFQVPRRIQRLLEGGKPLEDAIKRLTGRKELGRGTGLVGWMSGGRVTRSDLVEQSVTMAFLSLEP